MKTDWRSRHLNDPYVKRAQKDGYRSRAAYKLLELDEKDKFFKKGQQVIDLGAAPGGWSQVAAKKVSAAGQVVALDLLEMEPVSGVEFLQGDFTEDSTYEALLKQLSGKKLDIVLSDMAPNLSGDKNTDQARIIYLAELVSDFAAKSLQNDGCLIMKSFQGEGFMELVSELRKSFKKVAIRKPKASRSDSNEVYIVASGYNTINK